MRTKLLFLGFIITFFFNGSINGQTTTIIDSNFEKYLEEHKWDGTPVSLGDPDSMGDGLMNSSVPTAKIDTVTTLTLNGLGIDSLTGLEDFTALESFFFSDTQSTLTNIDLTSNLNLKDVNIQSFTNLTSMNLNGLVNITKLNFHTLPLVSLDLSTLTSLVNLQIGSLPQLNSLNIKNGNNANFTQLVIYLTPLLNCVVADANTPALGFSVWSAQSIIFDETCSQPLTYVPDDNFEAFLEANSMGNGVINDDKVFTNNISAVTILNVSSQSISDMTGIENFTALVELNASSNAIEKIDMSKNTNLEKLVLNNNLLEEIDVSKNTSLKQLWVRENKLKWLDVSKNATLEWLVCSKNSIKNLDLSANTLLGTMELHTNDLHTLNLKNISNAIAGYFDAKLNPNLTCVEVDDVAYWTTTFSSGLDSGVTSFSLDCSYPTTSVPDSVFENYLETHDRNGNVVSVGDVTSMGNGTANDNKVFTHRIYNVESLNATNLGISDLTGIEDFKSLKGVALGGNNLTTIDFSSNTNLEIAHLNLNNLTSLDLPPSIVFLNVRNNNFKSFDASMLPNLGGLAIYNNPDLEVLNVKNGNAVPWQLFLAYNTPKLTCVEVDDVNFFNSNFPSHNHTNSHTSYNTDCNYPTTNVPDSVFEDYLETHDKDGNVVSVGDATSMGNGIANDQKVFTYKICNVKVLDVSGKAIGDLTGLEDFRDLEAFGFLGGSNSITSMDLSNNTKLKKIHSGLLSNLSTITLGNLPDLTFLQFGYDNVTSIDISGLPNLDHFNAPQTKLTSLNTTNNPKLRVLGFGAPIKHLNVSSNTMLENLGAGPDLESLNIANGNNNNLTLSILNNPNLTCITADAGIPANGLSNWNIDSQHTFSGTLCSNSLTYVPDDNFENYLETHDASGNVVALGANNSMGNGIANDNYVFTNRVNTVTKLEVSNVGISSLIGLEDFVALEIFGSLGTNGLISIDFSKNNNLERIHLGFNNGLTDIIFGNLPNLTFLQTGFDDVTALDISGLIGLEIFRVFSGKLTSLNTSSNPKLKELDVNGSPIVSLDLSSNNLLEILIAGNGQLTSLNINNGANNLITTANFNIANNANLTCVEVSDVTYATTNWTNIDAGVNFNTDCSSVWTVMTSSATLTALLAITPSIDTSGDGNITLAEAAAYVGTIDLSNSGITDVEGLQAFTGITTLNVSGNGITDLSPLTNSSFNTISRTSGKTRIVAKTTPMALETLIVSNNNFDVLDVSSLTNLKIIKINDNPDLVTVNLKNGNNAAITEFNAANTPKLTCILVDDINASYLSNWTKDDANTYVADEADCRSRVLSVTQENLQEYISVYPNPIKDFVTVKLSNQVELKNVTVLNLLGKKVITTKQEKVSFGKLPSGIYLLRITTDKGIITKKIIKE